MIRLARLQVICQVRYHLFALWSVLLGLRLQNYTSISYIFMNVDLRATDIRYVSVRHIILLVLDKACMRPGPHKRVRPCSTAFDRRPTHPLASLIGSLIAPNQWEKRARAPDRGRTQSNAVVRAYVALAWVLKKSEIRHIGLLTLSDIALNYLVRTDSLDLLLRLCL